MYILDTDHLSVLERKGDNAQPLLQRMSAIDPAQISTTIISSEEQMRGWLSYIAKAQTEDKQAEVYKQLKNQLMNYQSGVGAIDQFLFDRYPAIINSFPWRRRTNSWEEFNVSIA